VHRAPRLLRRRLARRSAPAQALIELVLALSFLLLVLGTAIDGGMAYKTYQTLANATAEASAFLAEQPMITCSTCTTTSSKIAKANSQAINNFRFESGEDTTLRTVASMRDLDADGKDDLGTVANGGDGWDAAYLQANGWLQFNMVSDSQFTAGFDISSVSMSSDTNPDANPATGCGSRWRYELPLPSSGYPNRCYILVRAKAIYEPFLLGPIFGQALTIRAYAIKPISR
jgi:Flp pilus assembly protein TadG